MDESVAPTGEYLRPVPELAAWIEAKCPPVQYADGDFVRVGDYVDYGGRVGADGIHIARSFHGEVYMGTVLGVDPARRMVLVDECLNGAPRRYPVEELRFLGREEASE